LLTYLAVGACSDSAGPPAEESIRIPNGDVVLAGEFDRPASPGPHAVMVFVPGSGRGTREDDRAAAELVVPQGIALFRYDKRGLGESTGTFEEVTVENSVRVLGQRASDVRAIVEHLATRADVRANQIFLWGTSQGAWVAPLAASLTNRVAFVINVMGGGSPVGTVIEFERLGRDASRTVQEMLQGVASYAGPFGYDPQPTLEALGVPVLWIFGGLDRNTPSALDAPRLETIRQSRGKDFTIKVYPNMTHDMREATTGSHPATLFPDVFAWAAPRLGR